MNNESSQQHIVKELFESLDIPEKLRVLPVKANAGVFLYDLAKKNKFKSTLEVGFGVGASAAFILSATNSKHIAIDPFPRKGTSEKVGLRNLEKLGLLDNFTLHKDYSHFVLPKLVTEGSKIDFAFIDGDHKFDNIFVDFFYIDLLLKKNGFVLFDDAKMRTTQLVASFILKNKNNYREVKTPKKNFILLQKTSLKDERPWYHFEEFYNKKSIKSHAKFKGYDIHSQ